MPLHGSLMLLCGCFGPGLALARPHNWLWTREDALNRADAVFPPIANGVPGAFGKVAHNVEASEQRTAGRGRNRIVRHIHPRQFSEPCRLQERAHVVRRAEETGRFVVCPWYREEDWLIRPRHHLVQR